MTNRPIRGRRRRAQRHVSAPPYVARNRIVERFLFDTSHLPHRDAEEAWLLIDAAVQRTRLGMADPHDRPAPDRDDCLAGLAQRVAVQELDDIRELQLIDYARSLGVPWLEIGLALEYPPNRAKQNAYKRYHALAARYPYALAANRRPDGCGTAAGCTCNPNGLGRPDAGCDRCPHCNPSTEEPTSA